MPKARDLKELVTYLWMYMNKVSGNPLEIMMDIDIASGVTKKRKRDELGTTQRPRGGLPGYMSDGLV